MAAAIAALVVGGATPVLAQSPNFSNFSSTAGLSLNGVAAKSDTVLRLTPAAQAVAGSAWFNTPQPFANGFDTTFTFQLTGGSGNADGIAFVIQNAPSPLGALGYVGQGGPLGYGGDDGGDGGQGIPSSVAIEFDTYPNSWDPNSGHIAVQSCGALPNTSHHAPFTCPGSGTNPTIGITSTALVLTGSAHTVQIHYAPLCELRCTRL